MKNNLTINNLTIFPVILAAGKGTRMNNGNPSPIPKVLFPLGGKPIVSYILETLDNIAKLSNCQMVGEQKKILLNGQIAKKDMAKLPNGQMVGGQKKILLNCQIAKLSKRQEQNNNQQFNNLTVSRPLLVVGYKAQEVEKEFGSRVSYVEQKKRLGTGHAAKLAILNIARNNKSQITNNKQCPNSKKTNSKSFGNCDLKIDNCLELGACNLDFDEDYVLIMMGDDSAFYKSETLKKFIENHIKEEAVLSFLTTKIPGVQDLGRVIRDKNGNLVDIVEKENLTEDQKKIDEINCACYLAELSWLTRTIKQVKKHLKGGKEYPLPDIIKIALKNGEKVIAYEIPNSEFVGINSRDQLEYAEDRLKIKKQK